MKWLNSFNLSVTEKKGFLALGVLLFIGLCIRVALSILPTNDSEFSSTLQEEMEAWEKEQHIKMLVPNRFDPNVVSEEFIKSLALNKYAKENWIKYLRRKRRFESPNELLSVWGMDTAWFETNRDSIFISNYISNSGEAIQPRKFAFNPNNATRNQFIELGFPTWLADRILAYRAKGGVFKKPEDLLRIYDFPMPLYNDLLPFIRIDFDEEPKEISTEEVVVIELNGADSLALLTVKGIGPAFAHRILEMRQKFGGFVSKTQLLEIYGIDSEKLAAIEDQISINKSLVKQLNINKVSFKELNNHPYLNYNQVKAIVGYREKIGPIKNVSDLINLEGFNENDIEKLAPYLSVK